MPRFASVSTAELGNLVYDKDAPRTHKATLFAWTAFTSYLNEKNIKIDPDVISKEDLNEILIKFYAELRKLDGQLYKISAFRSIRHGLQRKFKTLQNIDIINDTKMVRSEITFSAQCVHMKKQGLAKVNHKPAISEKDIEKLYSSQVFALNTPKSLLRKVFFELMFFMCRRGQENLRKLSKSTFTVKKDENGVEYVTKNVDEFDKNHGVNDPNSDGGIILATGKENCPVRSFKFFIQKLNPKVEALFQRPKAEAPSSGPWFDAQVVGIKSLENMMKQISHDAGLSTIYTNHSIRVTCIT